MELSCCHHAMQELLSECGADKADDSAWLKLSEIRLSHNGLTELSASLVLTFDTFPLKLTKTSRLTNSVNSS